MPNVYLFRNITNHSVLISPYYRLQPKLLRQIRMDRPQLKIRPDHWTPFAILTGFKDLTSSTRLTTKTVHLDSTPGYGYSGKVRYPLPTQHEVTWKIPDDIKSATIRLCKALSSASYVKKEVEGVEDAFPLAIHWERDDYKEVVEEEGLSWPDFIQHKACFLLMPRNSNY